MSAYLAGLAVLRCAEHDRAAELRGTARVVLAAMGSFARSTDDPPVCVASHDAIALRAGLSRRGVINAQGRLEKLGVIERVGSSNGAGLRFTVRWALILLSSARGAQEDVHEVHKSEGSARGAQEGSARGAQEGCARGAHNPSESVRPPGREDGRRSAANAPGDPGVATPGATATSNRPQGVRAAGGGSALPGDGPPKIAAEVMAARGGTAEQAQKWIERRIAAATDPVRNEVAFIRGCLAKETAAPAKKATAAKKPAKKVAAKKAGNECSKCGAGYRSRTAWARHGFCETHYVEWMSGAATAKPAKPGGRTAALPSATEQATPGAVVLGRTRCPRCTRPYGGDRVRVKGRGSYHAACAEGLSEIEPQSPAEAAEAAEILARSRQELPAKPPPSRSAPAPAAEPKTYPCRQCGTRVSNPFEPCPKGC